MHFLVCGPTRAWNVFQACRTRKTWTFWVAYMSLTWFLFFFWHFWKNWNTGFLLLSYIGENGCVICKIEFFYLWVIFLEGSFLALLCYGNVCNWIPKLIWARLNSFWSFFWNVPRFVVVTSAWTKFCQNCSIVFLFWRNGVFSIVIFSSILVCCFSVHIVVSHRIL